MLHCVNKESAKCKFSLDLLRIIAYQSMEHNVRFFCKHISGKLNKQADNLSRNRINQFKQMAIGANPEPDKIPEPMWPLSKLLDKKYTDVELLIKLMY